MQHLRYEFNQGVDQEKTFQFKKTFEYEKDIDSKRPRCLKKVLIKKGHFDWEKKNIWQDVVDQREKPLVKREDLE